MHSIMKTLAATALVTAMPQVATAATWNVDTAHSQALFKVKHLGISTVTGHFNEWSGTIDFDPDNIEQTSATATFQVGAIDTNHDDRDQHLRSDDFFNAEKFPEITFESTKVTDIDGNGFKLHGNLTMRDVTKPVVLDVTFLGAVTDPWGNTKAGFEASTEINRQDFNVSWSKALDKGGLVVSDDVKIELELEVGQAKASES